MQTNPEGTATLNGVTISAGSTYINGNNANLVVNGITNNGTIQMNAGASSSQMLVTGDTTLGSNSIVNLSESGGGGTALIEMSGGGITLTNGGLIQGAGTIGNNGLTVNNVVGGTNPCQRERPNTDD